MAPRKRPEDEEPTTVTGGEPSPTEDNDDQQDALPGLPEPEVKVGGEVPTADPAVEEEAEDVTDDPGDPLPLIPSGDALASDEPAEERQDEPDAEPDAAEALGIDVGALAEAIGSAIAESIKDARGQDARGNVRPADGRFIQTVDGKPTDDEEHEQA